MADKRISLKLGIRLDPDIRETVEGVVRLICDAYDRGAISWTRRQEMLSDPQALLASYTYTVPTEDRSELTVGAFVEPSAAFLAEIGLSPS